MRATSRFSIAADYKPQRHGDTEAGKQGTARFAVAPLLLIPCLVLSPRLWTPLSFLGMQLDDVAVRKRMVPVDHLALKFAVAPDARVLEMRDRKSTRLNSSHLVISYAVFCLKKKNQLF